MLHSIFIVFETQKPTERPHPLKAFCQNVRHQAEYWPFLPQSLCCHVDVVGRGVGEWGFAQSPDLWAPACTDLGLCRDLLGFLCALVLFSLKPF